MQRQILTSNGQNTCDERFSHLYVTFGACLVCLDSSIVRISQRRHLVARLSYMQVPLSALAVIQPRSRRGRERIVTRMLFGGGGGGVGTMRGGPTFPAFPEARPFLAHQH